MRLEVTFRRLEGTDHIREHIESELKKLDKFYNRVIDTHVIVDQIKKNYQVEIVTTISGKTITVSNQTEDLIKTIDQAVNKLVRQLKRHKEKIIGR
jgi:putative sigma-54 modulation protein